MPLHARQVIEPARPEVGLYAQTHILHKFSSQTGAGNDGYYVRGSLAGDVTETLARIGIEDHGMSGAGDKEPSDTAPSPLYQTGAIVELPDAGVSTSIQRTAESRGHAAVRRPLIQGITDDRIMLFIVRFSSFERSGVTLSWFSRRCMAWL